MDIHFTTLAPWLADESGRILGESISDEQWERLTAGAERTGLAGLILERCADKGRSPPPKIADRLRRAATAVAASNLHFQQELTGIVQAFNRAGVPVMVLKGAALNQTIYRRPDLRPMSDVDLLVRPEHVEDALAQLSAHGCRRGCDLIRSDFFPKYHYEVELFSGGSRPVRLDLHARPFRPLRISRTMPDDALWKDARRVSIGMAYAWVPRDELMFVHLAAHAAFHGCSRLIWLYDLKRQVDAVGAGFDWKIVTDACRKWRLSHAVHQAIMHSQDALGPFIPSQVVATLAAHPTNWRDRLTLAQTPRDASSPAAHVLVDLLCTPGLVFSLGYLWAFAMPDRSHLAGLYPYRHFGWLLCAHAWRMVRGITRAVRGLATPFHRIGGAIGGVSARPPHLRQSQTGTV